MRIGIVNDMRLAREALKRVVLAIPGYQVAWTAQDGAEAVEMAVKDRPDLILMDLFMPRMDGAEATRRIMAEAPCPIVVVTATVSGHLNKVYKAMGHGALDAVDTPVLGPEGGLAGAAALKEKIDMIAKLIGNVPGLVPRDAAGRPSPAEAGAGARSSVNPFTLVLLGVSTGGPNALAEILGGLPRNWDACLLIVQHIDAAFAPGLAQWLGERTGHTVELAAEGDRPAPGRRLLAATNDHMVLSSRAPAPLRGRAEGPQLPPVGGSPVQQRGGPLARFRRRRTLDRHGSRRRGWAASATPQALAYHCPG